MNKEKQIEEMAKVLCVMKYKCEDCYMRSDCANIGSAMLLYEQDYRNCKDKVVLTKKEYELLMDIRALQSQVQESLNNMSNEDIANITKQAHKETASEILDMGNKLYKMSSHKGNAILRLMDWIKVEYGVIGEENV